MPILPIAALRAEVLTGPDAWLSPQPRHAQFFAAMSLIEQVEEGPVAQTRAFQSARLRRLLDGARRASAFWRERLPVDARQLGDLPIQSRADVQAQVAAEGGLPVPAEHGAVGMHATSGSTGVAITFHASGYNGLYNQFRNYYDVFAQRRDVTRPLTSARAKVPAGRAARWPGAIGDMFRTGPYRAIDIGPLTMSAVAEAVAAEPVGHLVMQSHVLSAVLDLVEAGTVRLREVSQILSFSETVDDALRARTRRLLGVRIADRYACEEFGPIAFQCPTDDAHYHVATSNVVVEVVDASGAPSAAGVPGRVLLTGLHSHATPFIRYEIGDLAALRQGCPCGFAGPTLSHVLGRLRALLRLPDGQRRFLRFVAPDWLEIAPVREFRVVQTTRESLVAELVSDAPLTATQEEQVRALLRAKSHPDFAVEVRRVERIDWGPSYKRIDTVCLVD